ncbi:Seminal metalloprotease 1 [Gryllus bimaculatus]|nr:Seminal metalloprotease 1 [Gryllus bimaculatus]
MKFFGLYYLTYLLILQMLVFTMGRKRQVPPEPTYKGHFQDEGKPNEVADQVAHWSPEDKLNVWEMSGLFEGDIMMPDNTDFRNVVLDGNKYWPEATVPYYIEKEDFTSDELETIKEAIDEYHENTCIKFRPYKKGDSDYIVVRGNSSGCWSYVGRYGGGQVVNLQTPGCVHRGIVAHELLHALGFYHQQSAYNRDDYIKIHYENIKTGREHNFKKYNATTVTDFDIGYDYESIMHYSAYAFSKNGEPTIEPLDKMAKIGQRKGLSKKDIKKLETLYHCKSYDDYWDYE